MIHVKAPFRIRRAAFPGHKVLLRIPISNRDRVLANNPLQLITWIRRVGTFIPDTVRILSGKNATERGGGL